eukprot:CAMPEP_0171791120 /NCGR_PEP_ID=MMETSP0991-20121206/66121_1 /TAXON_ID=483369 /ORGANISM="non described non described, Strain CCMP2098" /LENGTH=80 /DNA_ID=CAMNT_0012400831 /DNA_START=57 /DNA_END=295 /DNA_ORIENTATION=-
MTRLARSAMGWPKVHISQSSTAHTSASPRRHTKLSSLKSPCTTQVLWSLEMVAGCVCCRLLSPLLPLFSPASPRTEASAS